MKRLAIILTALTVIAGLATFGLGYVAIFTHDNDMGYAAYLTMWLDVLLGGGACFAWVNGGAA